MTQNQISITEGKHYRLDCYEPNHWEWEGLGVFSDYCCEHPFPTEELAREEAIKEILDLLNS